jgi:hypothetical protein
MQSPPINQNLEEFLNKICNQNHHNFDEIYSFLGDKEATSRIIFALISRITLCDSQLKINGILDQISIFLIAVNDEDLNLQVVTTLMENPNWVLLALMERTPNLIGQFHSFYFRAFASTPFIGPISSLLTNQMNVHPLGVYYAETITQLKKRHQKALEISLISLFKEYQMKMCESGNIPCLSVERYSVAYLISLFLLDPLLYIGISKLKRYISCDSRWIVTRLIFSNSATRALPAHICFSFSSKVIYNSIAMKSN